MFSIFALHIFLQILLVTNTASTGNRDTGAIFDITQILKDMLTTGGNRATAQKAFEAMASRSKDSNTPINLYYHTELDPNVNLPVEFQKIYKFLEESHVLNFTDKFFVTVRDKNWISQGRNSENYLRNYYHPTLNLRFPTSVKYLASKLVSFSIELPDDATTCREKPNDYQDIVKMLKDHSTDNVTIGYEFTTKNLSCFVRNEAIRNADYFFVRTRSLSFNSTLVYSYNIFEQQINRLIEAEQKFIRKNLEPTIGNRTVHYKMTIPFNITSMDDETRIRKKHLIENYVAEWTWKKTNNGAFVIVILDFPENIPATWKGPDLEWITSNNMLIPSIANLLTSFPMSASILLEDLVISKFDTIAINGSTWTKIARNTTSYLPCNKMQCRQPTNAIYVIDKNEPFKKPFVDSLRKFQNLSSMRMKTIMFTPEFKKNPLYVWKEIANAFRKISNHNTNFSSVCQIVWNGYINISNNVCDECLYYILTSLVETKCVIGEATNGYFWKLIISFKDETVDDFVERILKKFDTILRAREEILQSNRERNVILVIKGEFIGEWVENELHNDIYCSHIQDRVGQFYEAIFTWAVIHDIPIVLEQQMEVSSNFGNPLAWKKLKLITSPNDTNTQKMIDSLPLFVRRLHIQSKIFGSWTNGMYPCLVQARNSFSIQTMNFDSEYLGSTFKLDLEQENVSVTSDEIETLLLMVMKKFRKVDIIVSDDQLKSLYETLRNAKFMKILKANGINDRHLYIQSGHRNSYHKYLSEIGSIKPNVYFVIHIMLIVKNDSDLIHFGKSGLYDGIVHENCMSLAHHVTMERPFYMSSSNIRHLICQTGEIQANNSDKLKMQNFLNTHLYLTKLLKYVYPNLTKIYFRVNPTFANRTETKLNNLLLFLSDVHLYSKLYKIHYFILPAFACKNASEESPSFWDLSYYADLKNASEFEDILGEKTFLNRTWNQSNDERSKNYAKKSFSFWDSFSSDEAIYSGVLAILSLIITITIAILIKINRKRNGLSTKELNDFLNGQHETLTAAAQNLRDKQITIGNIYDGLVYQKDNEILRDDVILEMKNPLSCGKFWTTYRGTLEKSQNEVVVKIPHKNCSKQVFKCFLSEVKLLCYMGDHYNIARYAGCYTQELREKVLWIFMEYYPGGILLDHLRSRNRKRVEEGIFDKLTKFSREIASGMEYLVSHNVVHGNLSAKQVLLNQHLACKIKGFGFSPKLKTIATQIKNNHHQMLQWQWMAPELLKNSQFSNEADAWSYGVTLWEIFSLGDSPYPDILWSSKFLTEIENGMRMTSPAFATTAIFSIICECLEYIPERRPSFSKLVESFTGLMSECSSPKSKGSSNTKIMF